MPRNSSAVILKQVSRPRVTARPHSACFHAFISLLGDTQAPLATIPLNLALFKLGNGAEESSPSRVPAPNAMLGYRDPLPRGLWGVMQNPTARHHRSDWRHAKSWGAPGPLQVTVQFLPSLLEVFLPAFHWPVPSGTGEKRTLGCPALLRSLLVVPRQAVGKAQASLLR